MLHYTYNEVNSPFNEKCYRDYSNKRDIGQHIVTAIVIFGAIVALYTLFFQFN